jgi:hypothetical protein
MLFVCLWVQWSANSLNYCFSLQHSKRNHITPLPEIEALKTYTQTPLESSSIELNNRVLLARAPVRFFINLFVKCSEVKLICDRQSVGQFVWVSGLPMGPLTRFYLVLLFSADNYLIFLPKASSLTRRRVCSLQWNHSLFPITILYCLIWDCVPFLSPLTTRRDCGGGILTRLHTGNLFVILWNRDDWDHEEYSHQFWVLTSWFLFIWKPVPKRNIVL